MTDDDELTTWEATRAIIQPFRQQSHITHLLGIVGGVIVWAGVYYLTVHVAGWESIVAAASDRGIETRRKASLTAYFACGLYFAFLWLRGVGGPVLNVFYPSLIGQFMPLPVWTVFKPVPSEFTAMKPVFDSKIPFVGLEYGGPLSITVCLVCVWYYATHVWDEEQQTRFEKNKFPNTPEWEKMGQGRSSEKSGGD